MITVTIKAWRLYGDKAIFENIITEYSLEVKLKYKSDKHRHWLEAEGTEKNIYIFCQALKKKEIPFETSNLTMF